MTTEVPVLPSDSAVIVAVPVVTPVTTPELGVTVAIAGALVDQLTVRPVSTFPFASRSVAVSCRVDPRRTLPGDGVTVTVATGAGVTVTADDPDTVPIDALTSALPTATPVTRPLALTVAFCVAFDAHWNTTPGKVAFDASRATAVSCRVCPTATVVGLGDTATLVTPTATAAVPFTPSLEAVIVTAPAFSPVTRPVLDTTAMVSLLELQPTTRSVSTVVPERTVAAS